MQFSLSGALATMANGLPYSIGAAIAYPGRQVVCVVGDGGLSMLLAELATIAKYKLNVKVIVIKNNVLGEIKWEQMVLGGNPNSESIWSPSTLPEWHEVAASAVLRSTRPKTPKQILRQALNYPGPALVEAVVDPNEPPMPGKINTEQAVHFAEALARGEKHAVKIIETVFKDKVREVI